jgi:hypothetical protein
MQKVIRYLLSTFFLICAAIHIYGLFAHITDESTLSHIIHTLSYLLCFVAVFSPTRKSKIAYLIGTIYPFAYHLHCALQSALYTNNFNFICWLVAMVLLLGGWWLMKSTSISASDK